MIDLPQVTLVCADCVHHELAADAIRRSMGHCRFGRALFFTDRELAIEGVETVRIAPLRSVAEYSQFILKGLADHVRTSHALVVQWDGFVLDGGAWRDEFLDYDYIGAPWPWHQDGLTVGNGGFSLRSKRLLEALRDPAILNTANEDEVICRLQRPQLEARHAIRYAPPQVAEAFSFEHGPAAERSFGFHGLFNFGAVWPDDAALAARLDCLPSAQFRKNEAGWLLQRLQNAGRAAAALDLARRMRVRDLETVLREGLAAHEAGDLVRAAHAYREALALSPGHPDASNLLGVARAASGQLDEGIGLVRQAVKANPRAAPYHLNLGNLLALKGDAVGAVAALRKALSLDPGLDPARAALAELLQTDGRDEAARTELRTLLGRRNDDGTRLKLALTLPALARSRDHIAETRHGLERALDDLLARPARVADPLAEVGTTAFYLSYHGLDDRPLLEKLARAHLHACPSLAWTAPHCRRSRPPRARLRVGFLSKFLHQHSIGKTTRGLLARLDRSRFEVVALFVPPLVEDAWSGFIRRSVDRSVLLPDDLAAAREAIAALELDVLFYQDIGMEPMSYFLAFARLAPVQCVSFGHPDTTGIPNMDWFVSSSLYEPPGGANHYSERLAEIADAGTLAWYFRPAPAPARPRRELGLAEGERLYLCPQALFKLHPDFDPVLREILETDGKGRLLLVGSRQSGLEDAARRRLKRALGSTWPRVAFLPERPMAEFQSVLAAADVVLDTPHFNGMNSSLETFAQSVPVATWPGAFQRGRHTSGMLHAMGLAAGPESCVAASLSDYAGLAVRIASEPGLRTHLGARIAERRDILYENDGVVRGFEQFFIAAWSRRDALAA